jgi:hypothetical protein
MLTMHPTAVAAPTTTAVAEPTTGAAQCEQASEASVMVLQEHGS